jgi:hypothetical protein
MAESPTAAPRALHAWGSAGFFWGLQLELPDGAGGGIKTDASKAGGWFASRCARCASLQRVAARCAACVQTVAIG